MKKRIIGVMLITLVMMIIAGGYTYSKPAVGFKNGYLVINDIKYRTKGAQSARLFDIGYARNIDKVFAGGSPAVIPTVELDRFKPRITPIEFKATYKTIKEIEASGGFGPKGLDFALAGSAGAGYTAASEVSVTLQLLEFTDEDALKTLISSSENRAKVSYRHDPRMVTSVVMAFDYSTTNRIMSAGNVTVTADKIPGTSGPVKLTINGEKSGKVIVKISDGAVIAYEYSRICFSKRNRGKDGQASIIGMSPDRRWKPESDCPTDSTDDPIKAEEEIRKAEKKARKAAEKKARKAAEEKKSPK